MRKIDIQCTRCDGTGLYVGMAERDGAAVICSACGGTGKCEYNYEPFVERRLHKDVVRVFKQNCGYVHSGTHDSFKNSGCSYEEWLNGVTPKPHKELYCPHLWESQNMQNSNHRGHALYRERCLDATSWGSCITKCKLYACKNICWEKYDKLGDVK